MNEDIRKIQGAHWGSHTTCKKCGQKNTWLCTQTDLCMSCKFPSTKPAPASKMVEKLKAKKK